MSYVPVGIDEDGNLPPEARAAIAASPELSATIAGALADFEGGSGGGVDPQDVGYDIVIAIGQSNMSKSGGPVLVDVFDTPDPRIWQWAASGSYSGKIVKAIDPLLYPAADLGTEVAPPMQFAREWIKRISPNRQVLIVPAALGGTSLVGGTWAVGGAGYLQAISLANAAIAAAGANARVVAFLWIQGEAEAVGGGTQAAYEAAFDPMIAGFRAAVTGASGVPFVVGSMVPEWRNAPNGSSLAIHAAHVATPSRVSNAYFVDGPTGMNEDSGGIHYNAAGMREIGKRMCEALWMIPAVPPVVSGLAAVAGNASVSLTWVGATAFPGVTDYVVQYRATGAGEWTTLTDGVSSSPFANVTGLTNGTGYDFRVAAVNPEGAGPYSVTATATPAEVSLPTPTYLVDARTLGLADGASVTTWDDLSSNAVALDATQATAGSRPTYRATGINGHPSLQFDGGDSLATVATTNAFANGSGQYTVVAVCSVDAINTTRGIIGARNDSNGSFHLATLASGEVSFSTLNGGVSSAGKAGGIAPNTPVVIFAQRSATEARIWVNGVEGTPGASNAPAANGTSYPFTVGRVSNALWPWLGHIGYLAIYPGTLTTEQRALAQTTLMDQFGIS